MVILEVEFNTRKLKLHKKQIALVDGELHVIGTWLCPQLRWAKLFLKTIYLFGEQHNKRGREGSAHLWFTPQMAAMSGLGEAKAGASSEPHPWVPWIRALEPSSVCFSVRICRELDEKWSWVKFSGFWTCLFRSPMQGVGITHCTCWLPLGLGR